MDKKLYSGTLELGNTIIFCDRMWIICHIDGDKYYLGAKEIDDYITFGHGFDDYARSNLAKVAAKYQDELSQRYPKEVEEHLVDVTVEGVISKVFVPSVEQMDDRAGGFDYFNSALNRICKHKGKSCNYWTSSPYYICTVWIINCDGEFKQGSSHATLGFRPFVCFKP